MAITLDRDEYSVPEAAKALGVSPSTVWRWIDAKRLPAIRVGARKIVINRRDLAELVAPARTEAPQDDELLTPIHRIEWTPEVQAEQEALVAGILARQQGRSISPRTTAELIRNVREEREERYASWSPAGGGRVGGSKVASSR